MELSLSEPRDLSRARLTKADKLKLVSFIKHDRMGYDRLCELFNMKLYTLRKYCKRVNKNIWMHDCGGRPLLLDDLSRQSMMLFIANTVVSEKSVLYNQIKSESKETCCRRKSINIEDLGEFKISRSSLNRWSRKPLEEFNESLYE